MFLTTLGILGAILLLILILAALQRASFLIKRSILIQAPASKILMQLKDFKAWRHWSPWEGLDPELKRQYLGAEQGLGAIYKWEGKGQAGKGSMEILELKNDSMKIRLDFEKPFEGHNEAIFQLATKGSGIELSWSMSGPAAFHFKVMHLLGLMDRMVGKSFESGLENLKKLAEA
jgi:hypothetical protein